MQLRHGQQHAEHEMATTGHLHNAHMRWGLFATSGSCDVCCSQVQAFGECVVLMLPKRFLSVELSYRVLKGATVLKTRRMSGGSCSHKYFKMAEI